jgi:hypothetical protein
MFHVYFGPPLNEPLSDTPSRLKGLALDLKGCELLSRSDGKMTLVAKSMTPEAVVKENENKSHKIRLQLLNLSRSGTKVNLPQGQTWAPVLNRNGIEVNMDVHPGTKNTLSIEPKFSALPFDFAVFGNTEGNDNPLTNRHGSYFVWNNLVSEINKRKLCFAVQVGDLFSSGKKYHWRRFQKRISMLHCPYFPILGNKDVVPAKGREYFRSLFGKENFAFQYAGFQFVFLDNSQKSISPHQWSWLEDQLNKGAGQTPLVFLHIPPFHPHNQNVLFEGWDVTSADRFTDLMHAYHVKAVFGSHLHSFAKGIHDGVEYYLTGGGGGRLDNLSPGYHFLSVHAGPKESIHVEVVSLSNKPMWLSRILGKFST